MSDEIALALLLPHPLNANRMDAEILAKLRRHIEQSGNYEPLTVRAHPSACRSYESRVSRFAVFFGIIVPFMLRADLVDRPTPPDKETRR